MQIDFSKENFSDEFPYNTVPTICSGPGISFPEEENLKVSKSRRHFLKFFLDVSYYLCVIPYKIVVETEDGIYLKKCCRLQQMLCLIVHLIGTVNMLTDLRSLPFGRVSESPRMYFDIFVAIVHTAVIVAFCYSMWKSAYLFCKLVTTVQMCPIISKWYPKRINWVMFLVTLTYVIMAFLNPIYNEGHENSWESLFNRHAMRGRYILFFPGGESSSSPRWNSEQNKTTGMFLPLEADRATINYYSLKFPNVLFALLSYFTSTAQWLIIYHVDLIVNVMSLTLWCATSFFVNTLKQQACKQAIGNYEALKNLTCLINAITGTIVLTYTVDSILYYATRLESLFTGKNWFAKVVVLQFLLSAVSWLHFASCACLMMDKFRDFVRQKDNRSILPTKSISIMLLLDEISANTVALSGNGLFTINYKFVAQALTTVMTYFILVIQFNK